MPAAIAAHDLRHRFGDHQALDGVDLEVETGTVLALLGPNGAGKTTAVRVLTTQLRPDHGTATVAGHDVVRAPDEVRRSIGLAGQHAAVDERLTARENLALVGRLSQLGRADARRRALELLTRFSLDHVADQPLRTFSGGMRRRVDLAAALVAAPPVLFLDEPTTGLDPAARIELWDVLRDLVHDGTTLLLTTQYLEEAHQLADRVALVDAGRIVAEGTTAELARTAGDEVLELGLADAHAAASAARRVAATVRGVEATATGRRLVVRAADLAGALAPVLAALDGPPREVAVRGPSLDDAFLALTGAGGRRERAPAPGSTTMGDPTAYDRPTVLAGGGR